MDEKLISDFRYKVCIHDLILHIYRNYEGKNKWSAICSAMDWIEVGLSGIDTSYLQYENTNEASIKVITFISCIDVMWEGIQQLYRVFFNTKDIPFEGNKDIFHKEKDDNQYWKEIRATFAAHPSNIDGKETGEHRFASWSGGGFRNSCDFSVIVYSNDPSKNPEFFDINFDEIMAFAVSRYNYLNVLMKRVDEVTEKWLEKCKKTLIAKPDEILHYIDLLIEENRKRLGNEYYNSRLQDIKVAFTVESRNKKNEQLLDDYKEELKKELKTIRHVLQKMDLDYNPENNESCDLKYVYENQCVFEPGKGMIDWAVKRLKKPLGQYVDLDSWDSIDELQILVRAGWWKYNQEKKKA